MGTQDSLKNKTRKNLVVVTGDVTMDWNLACLRRGRESGTSWNADDTARICWQHGGAALLADVISVVSQTQVTKGRIGCKVCQMSAPNKPVQPGDRSYHHSYAIWAPFTQNAKSKDGSKMVWRVEEFLGLDGGTNSGDSEKEIWKRVKDDPPDPFLVVLDDAALGFRDQPDLWPQAIKAERYSGWVLMKMARPVAQGPLWEHLVKSYAERLITVLTVNDLRRSEVQVSRELSWERTAQDLFWELTHNPRVNSLSRCAHVVISFDTAGVLLLSRSISLNEAKGQGISWHCRLFFDPKAIEGIWTQDYPGAMIGYTSCLTTGIARQLMLHPDKPAIDQGIQSGVAAMRRLHLEGYGTQDPKGPLVRPAFPVQLIADELAKDETPLAEAKVPDPVVFLNLPAPQGEKAAKSGFWTILQDLCLGAGDQEHECLITLDDLAKQILLRGVETALKGVPIGQFGKLITVDRREIEAYRSICNLINEYYDQPAKRPLSIAVFGPPGSGKSFAVEQVANSIKPGSIEAVAFNLSAFRGVTDLVNALHQVRDIGLSGKLPLVFWDEFDTPLDGQDFGWLRYFLAPMQDGSFQDGQITHPIGYSIFVFAGGTSGRMEDFDKGADNVGFTRAKGPDFVSRLKGYVNIIGPDPQDEKKLADDPHYLIRRAILLHSLLERNTPQLFEEPNGKGLLHMDPGVLRAFLHVRKYKHGVRSMEAIIAMSMLTGKNRFERSCLPAEAQINLHVDGIEFLSLVHQPELGGELLEKLAQAAHQVFCDGQRGKATPAPASLLSYEELPPHLKEQNRGYVQDIIMKLASIGYIIVPARTGEEPCSFPEADAEKLAEMEHERWLKAKIEAGWQYGPERDDEKKTNPAMLPWRKLSEADRSRLGSLWARAIGTEELPEDEKAKDRDLINGIPIILAKAGYAMMKLRISDSDKESKVIEK